MQLCGGIVLEMCVSPAFHTVQGKHLAGSAAWPTVICACLPVTCAVMPCLGRCPIVRRHASPGIFIAGSTPSLSTLPKLLCSHATRQTSFIRPSHGTHSSIMSKRTDSSTKICLSESMAAYFASTNWGSRLDSAYFRAPAWGLRVKSVYEPDLEVLHFHPTFFYFSESLARYQLPSFVMRRVLCFCCSLCRQGEREKLEASKYPSMISCCDLKSCCTPVDQPKYLELGLQLPTFQPSNLAIPDMEFKLTTSSSTYFRFPSNVPSHACVA